MTQRDVIGCLGCDLAAGRRPLPGGAIYRTPHWVVEHCVGSLGTGTLLIKPIRHLTRVSELTTAESLELGPLIAQTAGVVDELLSPEQVYVCLWSHAGGSPVHIHYIVQPVSRQLVDKHGAYGPRLQAAMFDDGEIPSPSEIESFATLAKAAFSRRAAT